MANTLGISEQVCFHGYLPRSELDSFYARAHFLLLPSRSEGWPKVLSEAMAYGVVPLVSDVSSIPQNLAEIGCGVALPGTATGLYVAEILDYLMRPERWSSESQNGRQASRRFTYEAFGANLNRMFEETWGLSLLR
jgi:glycosyltransferase involved in cell wall biosynthesis